MNVVEAIKASEKVSNIIDDLFVSVKREQVEDVFSRNSIVDKSDRIQLLRKCMNVLDTSNIDNSLSIEDEYSDEIEMFLNGKWRFLI
jgi:hypothetical protein